MSSPRLKQSNLGKLATNAIDIVFELNKDSGRNEIKRIDLNRDQSNDIIKSNPALHMGYKPLSSFKRKHLVTSRIAKLL